MSVIEEIYKMYRYRYMQIKNFICQSTATAEHFQADAANAYVQLIFTQRQT